MSYYNQSIDQPLYEDILWNKPETKALAGKLLTIGGNAHSIAAPSQAFSDAIMYGAGEARVILPKAAQQYFKQTSVPPEVFFAESTPSGSFSHAALSTMVSYSQWADYIVIAGDMTKNSETTTVTADLLSQTQLPITIAGDSIDALQLYAETLFSRHKTVCIMNFAQLQKYSVVLGYHSALTSSLTNNRLVGWLEEFSKTIYATIVCVHDNAVYVAANGTVITTRPFNSTPVNTNHLVAACSVWAMQHPARTTEAIATALTQIKQ